MAGNRVQIAMLMLVATELSRIIPRKLNRPFAKELQMTFRSRLTQQALAMMVTAIVKLLLPVSMPVQPVPQQLKTMIEALPTGSKRTLRQRQKSKVGGEMVKWKSASAADGSLAP